MAIAVILTTLAFALLAWANRPLRSQDTLGAHRHWLVLPDEPAFSTGPEPSPGQSFLPAVIRVQWRKVDEDWRSAKPAEPWFRLSGFAAVTVAVGLLSTDLSALGLGVPEIFPTHDLAQNLAPNSDRHHEQPGANFSDLRFDALFDTHGVQTADAQPHANLDYSAWLDTSDFILPASHQALHDTHEWWA
jgi:hypothetical protein